MGAIFGVWTRVRDNQKELIEFETRIRAEQIVETFESWIDSQVRLIHYVATTSAPDTFRSREDFTETVDKMLTLYPNFQALNWVDSDWVIRWVAPYEGNENAQGIDLRSHTNPDVVEAVRLAVETDTLRRTPVIDLLQGGKGFATYRPVRDSDGGLLGLINGVFRIDHIALQCTNQPRLRDTFHFMLLSRNGGEIYRHGDSENILQSPYLDRQSLAVVDSPWTLLVAPAPDYLRTLLNPMTTVLFGSCIFFAAFLALLLGMHLARNKKIRENEERFRLIIENQTDMLVKFDSEGNLNFVSPSFCRTFGREESVLLGSSFAPLVHEQDRERVEAALEKVHQPPHRVFIEERALTSEGWRWQAWLNTGIVDDSGRVTEIVAVGRDISEQKEAQLELARSEERFRNLVHQASDAFFVCDSKGYIRDVNEQACRNLGYTREELLELHMTDVAKQVDRETLEENYARIGPETPLRKESLHFRKDGSTLPVEVSVGLLETGEDRLYLAIARDVSERKRAEKERRELDQQIQQMQKLESLGVLAGGIAHDFNNLLLAIVGNADLAMSDLGKDREARAYIEEIQQAAARAAQLCSQMLAYSGKGRFMVESVDIREAVEKMETMLEVAVSKKAAMSYRFAPGLPRIEVDPMQFQQVVIGLVTNASEALEGGTGDVILSAGRAALDREGLQETLLGDGLPVGEYVYLKVSDTGCGMDAETVEKMFDPFFTTKFTGRGLGMAAVLGIVRGHRGTLSVESELGAGTSVTIYLPASTESWSEGPAKTTSDGNRGGRNTILVVDDEEIVLSLTTRMLTRMGYRTLSARDGREGIRVYRENRTRIGCVILDLMMPVLDGEETLKELKRIDPNVRVLLSSGYAELSVTERFEGKGLAGFLQKPYKYETLKTRIDAVLGAVDPVHPQ